MISITHQQLLLFRSANANKEPSSDAVPKFMQGAIALICLIHVLPDLWLYGKIRTNELPRTFLDGPKQH
jgi:hypothetical protein